jgi:hypothetical protein
MLGRVAAWSPHNRLGRSVNLCDVRAAVLRLGVNAHSNCLSRSDFSVNVVQAMDRSLLVDVIAPALQPAANAWASRMFGFGGEQQAVA